MVVVWPRFPSSGVARCCVWRPRYQSAQTAQQSKHTECVWWELVRGRETTGVLLDGFVVVHGGVP
mgnify:CR=1 FL=1